MYKLCKTEQSVKRQREIELALFEMMKVRNYEDISVTALCEAVGMPRKAFYRYFDSKDDAVRGYVEHTLYEYEGFRKTDEKSGKRSLRRELEMYFEFWQRHKEELRVFERSGLINLIANCSINFPIGDRISTAKFLPNDSDVTRKYIFKFAFSGLTTLMLEWYKGGFPASVEQMAEVASRLLSKPLFANLADIGMEE